ncbi:MAG: response regulator, partial [Bacilli bacterium]|nr:response regulator [Bacilli bacterium]
QDEFSKIFNKFERLGVEKDTSIQGTGLGLSITKSLVEMLGGNITVSSQYGKGSIFIINIPQKISDAPVEKKEVVYNNDTKVSYGNKKVLLVDEDKVNIKIYRKELEDFNLTIDECNSSSECFEKIITGREYSLILMSLSLEELNGYKTLERLKENPTFEIPVIALTNDPDADIEKIKSSGFYDCVIKSFTKEEMKEKLDKLFRKTNFGDNFVMEAFSDMSKPVKDIVIPNSVDASNND